MGPHRTRELRCRRPSGTMHLHLKMMSVERKQILMHLSQETLATKAQQLQPICSLTLSLTEPTGEIRFSTILP